MSHQPLPAKHVKGCFSNTLESNTYTLALDEPKSYLGIAAARFPNYFFTLGPNCPIGNGPVLIAIEAEVDYMMKVLARFQKENWQSFCIKSQPVEEFCKWKDQYMTHTIWTEECRSWYKSGSSQGKVVALWPGSTLHYMEVLQEVRWEHYDITYSPGQNSWAFLGTGESSAEARTGDLSFYIRNHDDASLDPCLKPSHWAEKRKITEELSGVSASNADSKTGASGPEFFASVASKL